MLKKILDVGNCAPDHEAIRHFLSHHFDCQVDQAHGLDDTLVALCERDYALVLINRKLDRDDSDGIEILKQIKGDKALADVPVMLVTNFTEHQVAANAAGAEPGFGKMELGKQETLKRLQAVLT